MRYTIDGMGRMRICFMQASGASVEVEAPPGTILMRAAIDNGVEEILGECGGACICATCHVIVADQWRERLPQIGAAEQTILKFVSTKAQPGSRLSCQLALTADLDGLVVVLPETQV